MTEAPADQHPVWVPEQVAQVQSCGAHGHFVVTNDITAYCRARIFARQGQKTPVFARFSRLPDAAQAGSLPDIHGFAVRFRTEDGDWDVVGQNTPVFFIRSPEKFPDLMQAHRAARQAGHDGHAAAWDFWSRSPESLHQLTMLMSDRGQPDSPRFMNGYGGHTYSVWNADRERFWVKFHFRAHARPRVQGGIRTGLPAAQAHQSPAPGQAVQAATARARDGFGEDLRAAIARGEFPAWTLYMQVMPEADAATAAFDPFDPTRVWPQTDFPLIEVGVMTLDRNLDPRFDRLDQVSLSPANLVPGIGHSRDRMLQARIFSCTDTMPNRHLGRQETVWPRSSASLTTPQTRQSLTEGASASDTNRPDDALSQAGALFRLLDPAHRQRLAARIAQSMQGAPTPVIERQLTHIDQADAGYGRLVREALESIRRGTIK